MIVGDKAILTQYEAITSHKGEAGEVIGFREVGLQMHTIDYEYLVRFFDGTLFWVPSRYLKEATGDPRNDS